MLAMPTCRHCEVAEAVKDHGVAAIVVHQLGALQAMRVMTEDDVRARIHCGPRHGRLVLRQRLRHTVHAPVM
jgi:hypothetical protein